MGLRRKLKDRTMRIRRLLDLHDTLRFDIQRVEMERSILESERAGVSDARLCDREVIVSLTTFGRRLEQVHLAIESLLRQSCPPNRLILWLEEGLEGKPLPALLERQTKRGLEIRYTPDIRSYKKIVPALIDFPDAVIITADDDIIYDPGMIDRLIRGHKRFPGCIVANSVYRLVSDSIYSSGRMACEADSPAMDLMAYTGNGALFPPGSLDPEAVNVEALQRLCPSADDIWVKAMSLKAGTPVVKVPTASADGWDFLSNHEVQDHALWVANVWGGKNDEQYSNVMREYGLSVNGGK